MYIYEPERDLEHEEIKNQLKELKNTLPDINFLDSINYVFTPGKISGYDSMAFINSRKVLEAFTEYKIAVVSDKMPEKSISALQKIGYNIPQKKMCYNIWDNETISPEEILWDELRNGKAHIIKKKLENLLFPILSSIKNADEYQFAVYNPFIVQSTDDVIPPYIEYDEIFSLPSSGNGLLNIDKLVEKIAKMSSKRALAFSSKIKINNEYKQIPMIDFKSTELELWEIENIIKRLDIPRKSLVNSGNSFHHYNLNKLINLEEFYSYANRISEQPEIGKNWPWLSAHQGFSLLRISPSAKKPFFPTITDI